MTKTLKVNQADIFLAKLDPVTGSEQAGTRPVLVISGNTLNENMPISIVCPLSSKIKNFSTCAVLKANTKNGLTTDSEVITFQVRTISKKRLVKHIGSVGQEKLDEIIHKLSYLLLY